MTWSPMKQQDHSSDSKPAKCISFHRRAGGKHKTVSAKSSRRSLERRRGPGCGWPAFTRVFSNNRCERPARGISPGTKKFFCKSVFHTKATPLWDGTIFGQVFGRGGTTKFSKWKVPPTGGSSAPRGANRNEVYLRFCAYLTRPSFLLSG